MRAIQRAIVDYATKICGTVDEDEPETAELARSLLQPITNIREQGASGRRPAGAPGEGEATEPTEGDKAPK